MRHLSLAASPTDGMITKVAPVHRGAGPAIIGGSACVSEHRNAQEAAFVCLP
jgi:hypothetical protein